jgi:hypothetical protein
LSTPSTDQRPRRVRRGKSVILYTVIVIIVKMAIISLCSTHDKSMKVLLLTPCLTSSRLAPQPGDFQGCPEQGQGGDPALNRLKNRSAEVQTPDPMTVAQINALPLPLEALHGKRATWPAHTLSEISAVEQQGAYVGRIRVRLSHREVIDSLNRQCYT